MAVPERLDVTLRLVRNAGTATLADLSARLGVSEMTVRRDLEELQRRGLVHRIRGGATAVDAPENGFAVRAGWQAALKHPIGRAAGARSGGRPKSPSAPPPRRGGWSRVRQSCSTPGRRRCTSRGHCWTAPR